MTPIEKAKSKRSSKGSSYALARMTCIVGNDLKLRRALSSERSSISAATPPAAPYLSGQ